MGLTQHSDKTHVAIDDTQIDDTQPRWMKEGDSDLNWCVGVCKIGGYKKVCLCLMI
ncbi:hypothetical protein Hanom_Chr07g00675591 [Helianthus anomalus]